MGSGITATVVTLSPQERNVALPHGFHKASYVPVSMPSPKGERRKAVRFSVDDFDNESHEVVSRAA
jgi:hypothetical protein